MIFLVMMSKSLIFWFFCPVQDSNCWHQDRYGKRIMGDNFIIPIEFRVLDLLDSGFVLFSHSLLTEWAINPVSPSGGGGGGAQRPG